MYSKLNWHILNTKKKGSISSILLRVIGKKCNFILTDEKWTDFFYFNKDGEDVHAFVRNAPFESFNEKSFLQRITRNY